jgi:hypothetical protein
MRNNFQKIFRRICHRSTFLPGVDVMIKIFGDFRQFSAKNWRFFQKQMAGSTFLHNLALL